MEVWDENVESIEIDGEIFTKDNLDKLPAPKELKKYLWSLILPLHGKQVIVYFNNEEELANWLIEHEYNNLANAFEDAMEIRKKLIEMIERGCLDLKTLKRWFCEVQTTARDRKFSDKLELSNNEHQCHWIFDIVSIPGPGTRFSDNSKHINDRAAIPDLSLLSRDNDIPPNWNKQIKSLEICVKGAGSILYIGKGFQPPAGFFAGDPGGQVAVQHTNLVIDSVDYKLAQSLQDAGRI